MQYVPSSADVCPKFHRGFTLGLAKGLFGAGPWFKVSLGFIQDWELGHFGGFVCSYAVFRV